MLDINCVKQVQNIWNSVLGVFELFFRSVRTIFWRVFELFHTACSRSWATDMKTNTRHILTSWYKPLVFRFLHMEFHCSKLYLCGSHDIAVKLLKVMINNKNPALNQVLRLDEFGARVQNSHWGSFMTIRTRSVVR